MKYLVKADYDYVVGHLRYGHVEMMLSEEEYREFKELSEAEQKQWLDEAGDLVVDDYSCEDTGDLGDIEIAEVRE